MVAKHREVTRFVATQDDKGNPLVLAARFLDKGKEYWVVEDQPHKMLIIRGIGWLKYTCKSSERTYATRRDAINNVLRLMAERANNDERVAQVSWECLKKWEEYAKTS